MGFCFSVYTTDEYLFVTQKSSTDQPIDQQIDLSINQWISGLTDQSTSYRPGGGKTICPHRQSMRIYVNLWTDLKSAHRCRQPGCL